MILLLSLPSGAAGQFVHKVVRFPDGTRLEDCVRSHMTNKYANPIYEEDVINIKILRCNDPSITSLEGIEALANLEHLAMGLRGTKISDIKPLEFLTKLRRLELQNSNIDNISALDNLTNLYYLDLSDNHVTDLAPLDNLTNLQTLILYHQGPNYITDLTPLDNLTRMYVLDLEANKISDLTPLRRMHNLQYLHMMDNRLTSIQPLDNLTNLRSVNFSINALTDLTPLDNSTRLTTLIAKNNRINSIEFLDNMSQITYMDLSQNQISDLMPLNFLFRPVFLGFNANMVTDIGPINRIMWMGFLEEIRLSYNCIKDIDNISFPTRLTVQKLHQCDTPDPANDYDLATVVNKDFVGGGGGIDNGTDPAVMAQVSQPTGPGGCAVSTGSPAGDLLILSVALAAFLLYRKRFAE